jgi:hypothetical protein
MFLLHGMHKMSSRMNPSALGVFKRGEFSSESSTVLCAGARKGSRDEMVCWVQTHASFLIIKELDGSIRLFTYPV